MINRRMAMSGLSILTALGLLAGSTLAAFSDTNTSSTNTFSTGSLDLQLSNDGTTFASGGVTATFGASNLGPGDTSPVGTLTIRNAGTLAATDIDIAFANVNSDLGTPLDAVLRVTTLTYDGANILPSLTDTDSSGFIELDELAAQGLNGLALADLSPADHELVMQVTMDPAADNSYQGDNVTTDLTVTLNQ
ncbi:MAG: hypothetical protein HY430_03810 [Candidatus Levybacteria bacterium]|nr:hypothetical protein [Candidatus Levybacteria bacterium]